MVIKLNIFLDENDFTYEMKKEEPDHGVCGTSTSIQLNNEHTDIQDETAVNNGVEGRRRKSSRRILNKTCSINSTVDVVIGNLSDQEAVLSSSSSPSKTKSSRKWEGWTEDDTKWFFVALSEHGKDFQSIQAYMVQKSEKKGLPSDLIKNREQVRHYYYRTWHKINPFLNISDEVDKQCQELYGLINYGEIWKKFGAKTDSKVKLKDHLNELVFKGHTNIKVKGKVIKLKTPVCKALKKINKLDENTSGTPTQNHTSLPNDITVELHPRDNSSWLKVHSSAQNPRIRTKLPLAKRLSILIKYLDKRWSKSRLRSSECSHYTGSSVEIEDKLCGKLRIRPHSSIINSCTTLEVKKAPGGPLSHDLSFQAYLQKFHKDLKNQGVKKKSQFKANLSAKKALNEAVEKKTTEESANGNGTKCDSTPEHITNENGNSMPPITEAVRSLSLLKDMLASVDETENLKSCSENEEDEEYNETEHKQDGKSLVDTDLPLPPADSTLGQWLSGSIVDNKKAENHVTVEEDKQDFQEKDQEKQKSSDHFTSITHSITEDILENGWDSETAGSLTVGELYILMKRPEKILLEYNWPLTHVETGSNTNEFAQNQSNQNSEMSENVLSKLLTAAKLSLSVITSSHHNLLSPTKITGKNSSRKNKRLKLNSDVNPSIISLTSSDTQPVSHLLSSVISDTIFTNPKLDIYQAEDSLYCKELITESDMFLVPNSPAPKATTKSKASKEIDPVLVQEALKQLNSSKFNTRKHQRKSSQKIPLSITKSQLPTINITNSQSRALSVPTPVLSPTVSSHSLRPGLVSNTTLSKDNPLGTSGVPVVIPEYEISANITLPHLLENQSITTITATTAPNLITVLNSSISPLNISHVYKDKLLD